MTLFIHHSVFALSLLLSFDKCRFFPQRPMMLGTFSLFALFAAGLDVVWVEEFEERVLLNVGIARHGDGGDDLILYVVCMWFSVKRLLQ
jgi:hypothetical protein